jgi:hypothetical protein
MVSMKLGSGISAGLSMTMTSPSVLTIWYSTLGAVASMSMSYSRSSRSWMISIGTTPKNPPDNQSERLARFRLVHQRGIVQLQLFQRILQ